jgi:four helix bundle protein
MGNQLLRSGTSIGANVEEGQASQSEADFVSKYSIACKEARETHYWSRLLSESKIISPDELVDLMAECNELIAILTAIVKKVQAKNRDEK